MAHEFGEVFEVDQLDIMGDRTGSILFASEASAEKNAKRLIGCFGFDLFAETSNANVGEQRTHQSFVFTAPDGQIKFLHIFRLSVEQ